MPNKDWYWDQFAVAQNAGGLDMHTDRQSASMEALGKKDANIYESRFIDELYGTQGRRTITDDGKNYELSQEQWIKSGGDAGGAIQTGETDVTWGLDLVRDWSNFKGDMTVGSEDHYQWQTRGDIDWAHYWDDNAYQASFTKDLSTGDIEWDKGSEQRWRDKEGGLEAWLSDEDVDTQHKVEFLRDYDTGYSDYGDENLRDDWDNKYIDQFDPETATPYTPTYLDVPDLWGQADFEKVLTPMTVTKPKGLPSLSDIQRTQVQTPESLQGWGNIRSAPTERFQPGGAGE